MPQFYDREKRDSALRVNPSAGRPLTAEDMGEVAERWRKQVEEGGESARKIQQEGTPPRGRRRTELARNELARKALDKIFSAPHPARGGTNVGPGSQLPRASPGVRPGGVRPSRQTPYQQRIIRPFLHSPEPQIK